MTGFFLFDWLGIAVSLINTILLLWLGLTVLLNAERRTLGLWLTGGASILGSAFFAAHTAILASVYEFIGRGLNFWWRVGWTPLVAVPFIWYLFALWFSGFWEKGVASGELRIANDTLTHSHTPISDHESRTTHHALHTTHSTLRTRHRILFYVTAILLTTLVGMFLFTTLLPTFMEIALFDFTSTWTIDGIPLLLIIFPLYVFLCVSLALDAFRHPIPATNLYSNEARVRARPWLMAATAVLMIISVLVAVAVVWIFTVARSGLLIDVQSYSAERSRLASPGPAQFVVAQFDTMISALVTVTIYLIGQAMVSYEVLSGRTLPRADLRRHWRNIILLAVGYGLAVGGTLALNLPPIYGVVLTTGLLASFYALFNWRNFSRNEVMMRRLRAFAGSQNMIEQVLDAASPADDSPALDVNSPFGALCVDVLSARFAALVALGPQAPLAGAPLVYPTDVAAPSVDAQLTQRLADQPMARVSILTLNAHSLNGQAGPARYAVPLWSVRGLAGVLLLGDKVDSSLYTEEEIEVARATGERLIDTHVSAEVARRLLTLQRQRLAESQVLDRQTRRVLHDEVLPELHAALLTLNAGSPDAVTQTSSALTAVHRRISSLLRSAPVQAAANLDKGLLAGLHDLVDLEMRGLFEEVTWQIDEDAPEVAAQLSPLAAEVVFYAVREAVRNAARHGRGGDGAQPLNLSISIEANENLSISIEDNGIGVQGNGATQGSGQGLALHSTLLTMLGGQLVVDQTDEGGVRAKITMLT